MLYYFAPLEGITNATYRTVHHIHFSPMDRYMTPFFVPTAARGLSSKDKKALLPEMNQHMPLVPQLLTNRSEAFLRAAQQLQELGYSEVNLNLGCPSGTVVAKKRGAGFLANLEDLKRFLDEVCSAAPLGISIKTRLGLEDPSEFDLLLQLFNQYPLTELILHPRVQKDFYRNHPNLSAFQTALHASKHPVVYSGDLFTPAQILDFAHSFPTVKGVMLGRGLIANPALAEQVINGTPLTKERLWHFHESLYARYQEILFGSRPVLHKMKELWHYMICLFPESDKYAKRLRKAQSPAEYEAAVQAIFRDLTLSPDAGYHAPHE